MTDLLDALMRTRPGDGDTTRSRWPAWHTTAPCLGHHRDFYGHDQASQDRAKAICAGCDHRAACLDEALSLPISHDQGVRAGLTDDQRRRMPRTAHRYGRTVARCGTESGYRTHHRLGEGPCLACRDAKAAADRARRGSER